ncbi:MAG: efflux RND transporter permease subunit [Hyphomicrobiaceae bacterium]
MARFDNKEERLVPGQFIKASVLMATLPNAVVIDTKALQINQKGRSWCKPDMTVELRSVEIGPEVGQMTVINHGLGWAKPSSWMASFASTPAPGSRPSTRSRRPPRVPPASTPKVDRMNPAELCIKRPVMTTLVMAAIVLFGFIAYHSLPVSSCPLLISPPIEISASLPGANPETMASAVATPIENQLSRVAGIKAMTSVSSTGSSKITVEFELDRNIDAAALDVQTAISAAQRSLPAEMTDTPSFRKVNPTTDFAIYYMRLSSATLPIATLSNYAETVLQQRVSTLRGVAQVQFWGQQRYAVRIQIDPRKLVTKNVSFDDLDRAIKGGNS